MISCADCARFHFHISIRRNLITIIMIDTRLTLMITYDYNHIQISILVDNLNCFLYHRLFIRYQITCETFVYFCIISFPIREDWRSQSYWENFYTQHEFALFLSIFFIDYIKFLSSYFPRTENACMMNEDFLFFIILVNRISSL